MAEQAATYVVPSFWIESVEELRDFYLERLGFTHLMGIVGRDGRFDFGIVVRDGIHVMMGRPQTVIDGAGRKHPTDRPVEVNFYLKDVDGFHREVVSRGVAVVEPLTTQWWGDRTFSVRDPYGYTLRFCQTVGQPEPPPGVTMV